MHARTRKVRNNRTLGHSKCFPSGPFTKTHAGGRLLSIIYLNYFFKMDTLIILYLTSSGMNTKGGRTENYDAVCPDW